MPVDNPGTGAAAVPPEAGRSLSTVEYGAASQVLLRRLVIVVASSWRYSQYASVALFQLRSPAVARSPRRYWLAPAGV